MKFTWCKADDGTVRNIPFNISKMLSFLWKLLNNFPTEILSKWKMYFLDKDLTWRSCNFHRLVVSGTDHYSQKINTLKPMHNTGKIEKQKCLQIYT